MIENFYTNINLLLRYGTSSTTPTRNLRMGRKFGRCLQTMWEKYDRAVIHRDVGSEKSCERCFYDVRTNSSETAQATTQPSCAD